MKGSHHVNWNSIICRKGSIHRTEIERPFLAGRGSNTNLVQFLLPYHVIISNVHVCSFMCMISHVHRRAPTTVFRVQNLVHKKFLLRPVWSTNNVVLKFPQDKIYSQYFQIPIVTALLLALDATAIGFAFSILSSWASIAPNPIRTVGSLAKFGMKSVFDCMIQMKLMSSSFILGLAIFCNAFTPSESAPIPSLLIVSPKTLFQTSQRCTYLDWN